MLLGVSAGIAGFTFAAQASHTATGKLDGYPPPTYFVFGSVALLAAIGDARMIRARGISGAPRLARHLWRMCIAMLIGTGSFFLGKAHLLPKPLRIMPVLASPVILVLLLRVYWLVRLRIKRSAIMPGDQSPPTQLVEPIQLGN